MSDEPTPTQAGEELAPLLELKAAFPSLRFESEVHEAETHDDGEYPSRVVVRVLMENGAQVLESAGASLADACESVASRLGARRDEIERMRAAAEEREHRIASGELLLIATDGGPVEHERGAEFCEGCYRSYPRPHACGSLNPPRGLLHASVIGYDHVNGPLLSKKCDACGATE